MQKYNLAISSLASGSSGNSYLVMTPNAAVLVDAGISAKQISASLSSFGLCAADLKAIFITHEHSDHIKGLKPISKASGASIFMTPGTMKGIEFADELDSIQTMEIGQVLEFEDLAVCSFATSHDAQEPCGYFFASAGRQISIITDTGYITNDCRCAMQNSDIIVLESNHDESVLRMGRYPWFLKQRILSDFGHLSNEAAAQGLLDIFLEELQAAEELRPRQILLAHLSKENNFPEMALATVKNVLASGGIELSGKIQIEVLSRSEQSPLYVL